MTSPLRTGTAAAGEHHGGDEKLMDFSGFWLEKHMLGDFSGPKKGCWEDGTTVFRVS